MESPTEMPNMQDISGVAALTICEALILSLSERRILPAREIMGALLDAAARHEHAPAGDGREAMHKSAAALINKLIDNNSLVLGRR